MRTSKILVVLLVVAATGLALFGFRSWRSPTVERIGQSEARRRFAEVRAGFGPAAPLLGVDPSGGLVRNAVPPVAEASSPDRMVILVYRARRQRLVRAVVPFWLVWLKGPGLKYALRGTGLDMEQLVVAAGDLQMSGPALVLDETRANGDRVLVWTE